MICRPLKLFPVWKRFGACAAAVECATSSARLRGRTDAAVGTETRKSGSTLKVGWTDKNESGTEGARREGGREGGREKQEVEISATVKQWKMLMSWHSARPREYGLGAPGVDDCVRKATRACDIIHIAGRR